MDTVVVGEIKEIIPHPNADKLQITKADIGSEILQIVCGAPNIAVGQKVPVALIGTKLPGGEIKQAKIRDVDSFGMLCAPDEIGFGTDHSGIMILDPDLKNGSTLFELFNDTILDGSILANRGDLQNHVGIAREISAIYGGNLHIPDVSSARYTQENQENVSYIDVKIENIEACPLYTAQLIKNIKIGPSPLWMQQALLACDMKPINNVVDITNYVMLEQGNPLHAFDYSRIDTGLKQIGTNGGKKIIVRLTKQNESIRTLDGEDHDLPEGLLVIANEEAPIAVAGVMGGENSEIDETTTDIILESANFNQKYIRKSQRELGMATEASSRFAKDLSPYLAFQGLERATQLFIEICGGELVGGRVIAGVFSFEKKKVPFDFEKIKEYLSIDISKDEAIKILEDLGFTLAGDVVEAPFWRKDISIWQDLAEEVGRIYGLDRCKEKEPSVKIDPKTEKSLYFEQSAKRFLSSIGLFEIYTLSMLSSELIAKTRMADRYFEISNPMNEYDRVMRSSLMNGLLQHAVENSKKFEKFSFFELSKVYLPSENQEIPSKEERHLGFLVYGENPDEGLYITKKYIEKFAEKFELTLEIRDYNLEIPEYMHPGRCGKIYFQDNPIGSIYELHPMIKENLGFRQRCWLAELNFDILTDKAKNIEEKFIEEDSDVIYKEFSRFEVSKRDMAFVVDKELNKEEILRVILETDDRVVSADMFDEYFSDKFGEGKKSVAFHLTFQSSEKTLNDEEIDELFDKILDNLKNKFKAKLRR